MEDNKLNKYLDEIGRETLLTEEEERQLSAQVLAGDKRALDRLIEKNLRFVVTIARSYQGKGLSMDDLISEGNLGLMKAAAKYDARRGIRFVNYAVVFVRQNIEKALERESDEQRMESSQEPQSRPVDEKKEAVFEDALVLLNEREQQVIRLYYGLQCDALTMAEIGEKMGLKRERVRQIRDRALRRLKVGMRKGQER